MVRICLTVPSTLLMMQSTIEDVQKLHRHLEEYAGSAFCNLKEEATRQKYANLAQVTLAQIYMFIQGRAG